MDKELGKRKVIIEDLIHEKKILYEQMGRNWLIFIYLFISDLLFSIIMIPHLYVDQNIIQSYFYPFFFLAAAGFVAVAELLLFVWVFVVAGGLAVVDNPTDSIFPVFIAGYCGLFVWTTGFSFSTVFIVVVTGVGTIVICSIDFWGVLKDCCTWFGITTYFFYLFTSSKA